jgi:hypothetical protein
MAMANILNQSPVSMSVHNMRTGQYGKMLNSGMVVFCVANGCAHYLQDGSSVDKDSSVIILNPRTEIKITV